MKIYFYCKQNNSLRELLESNSKEIKVRAQEISKNEFLDIDIEISENTRVTYDLYIIVNKQCSKNPMFLGDFRRTIIELIRNKSDSSIEYAVKIVCESKQNETTKNNDSNETPRRSTAMSNEKNEYDYKELSKRYQPIDPLFTFDEITLSESVKNKILESIEIIHCKDKLFIEWGLINIQKHPSSLLNFYGASGTGKTMTAHGIASKLGKKIIIASYADIESKYVGEAPKMAKAIFLAAETTDSVLFIDEADSLLSKRLTNIDNNHAQSINSMRSQLLTCLEDYKGICIFATNMNQNYDKAILTRLINIEFKLPDGIEREKILNSYIHKKGVNIPLAEDVDMKYVANKYEGFSGRELRNIIIKACTKAVLEESEKVYQKHFISAAEEIEEERKKAGLSFNSTQNEELKDICKEALQRKSKKLNESNVTN
ncbi:ATP-binding protein [Treponema sp.]|uniref:ATP-binding protein n=1 Tax=Treponema sp. TaxID=166 RepID=UPI00298E42F6|nr:AAA family ATPase [Treponema sp.]MCQ2240136.1 AAA family ATPase [Treponema sp.]